MPWEMCLGGIFTPPLSLDPFSSSLSASIVEVQKGHVLCPPGIGQRDIRQGVLDRIQGKKELIGWDWNHSEALRKAGSRGSGNDTTGLGPLSPSLFDSVLATFSCSFSPFGGKMAASISQQLQQKTHDSFANRADRSPQTEPK